MANAASAAAMVIIKMAKNTPSNFPGYRYLLKAMKLIFTLFRINSMAISIVIMFRLVNNPYMPIKKRAVLTKRICVIVISVILVFAAFVRPELYQY
jgi:nucleoside recognition membrane protein YjiH